MSERRGGVSPGAVKNGLVSIIVAADGATDAALDCVERALPDRPRTDTFRFEVVVVGTAGDLKARVGARFPDGVAVSVRPGTSVAAARNAGAEAARGEYLVFIDRDAVPAPGWLDEMLLGLRANANAAAVAGTVLEADGTIAYAGAGLSFTGEPLAPDRGKRAETVDVIPGDVLFASPWSMAIDTKTFRWVGGFDAVNTPGIEHADLGWRLWLAGFRVRLVPDAIVRLAPSGPAEALPATAGLSGLAMLYKNLDEADRALALAGALALVDAEGMPAFRAALPALGKAREGVQELRQVGDAQIFRLFGDAMAAGSADEGAVDTIRAVLDIDALFSARRRVLVVTPDVLRKTMAGPAIRAFHMARALVHEHDVHLVTTVECELDHDEFPVEHADKARLKTLVAWADVVIFQGHVLYSNPWMAETDTVLVADIYDPIHLEVLEQARDLPPAARRMTVRDAVEVMNEQLVRGDFFLCASEKQRDFWLGQLAGVGRINPATYDDHANLYDLIAVAPFGIGEEPPVATERVLKGVVPGIGEHDKVILWGGGVYNWFDPLTLLLAVDQVRHEVPEVRLFFMGMTHPNPNVPAMQMAFRTRRLADELGLTDKFVIFNEDWIDYEQRHNYLLEADIGVSTHLDHVETAFSFRTRILDYIWASLPIVATSGDSFADLIERHGLGLTAEAGDVGGLERALTRLLTDDEFHAQCRGAIAEQAAAFRWSRVLEPLLQFCRDPRRAPDLLDPRQRAVIGDPYAQVFWGHNSARRMAAVVVAHLRAKEYEELADKIRTRVRSAIFPRH